MNWRRSCFLLFSLLLLCVIIAAALRAQSRPSPSKPATNAAAAGSIQTNADTRTLATNDSRAKILTNRIARPLILPPGHGLILSLSNQIAAIERKKAALEKSAERDSEEYNLRQKANPTMDRNLYRANLARAMAVQQQQAEYDRQIARLRLQELQYRKLYRLTNAP